MTATRLLPSAFLVAALLGAAPGAGLADAPGRGARSAPAEAARGGGAAPGAPLFEPNRGQLDPRVRFLARGSGFTAWLVDGGAVFAGPSRPGSPAPLFRMTFAGGGGRTAFDGEDPTGGRSNYLLGRDPAGWRRGVPHFRGVLAREVLPGIDVRWRGGEGGALRYDFLVRPGADPAAVALDFGARAGAALLPDGSLEVRTRSGSMRHSPPRLWQEDGARRVPVAGGFLLRDDGRVGLRVGAFDRRRTLVVDPKIDFSTYLGGTTLDAYLAMDMAIGPDGDAYLTGDTRSTSFPLVDELDTWSGGINDGFVSRLGNDGYSLLFSTFLGGSQFDEPCSIAVDPDGVITVFGRTTSSDFPITAGVLKTTVDNAGDLFITRIEADGSALVFSTYLGYAGNEPPGDMAVDASGAVFVTATAVSDWQVTAGAAQGYQASKDAVVAKIASDGTSILWSTFVGGDANDWGRTVAVDDEGAVYVAGLTDSTNFAPSGAIQTAYGGGYGDAFVAKIAPGGGSFAWRTYLGGTGHDEATAIAVDGDGRAVVAGFTNSGTGFPLKDPLAPNRGGYDAFLARLEPEGDALDFSTRFGGGLQDMAFGLALDAEGGMVVGGETSSPDFPLQDPLQSTLGGLTNDTDAFLLSVSPDATRLAFSTFLGGGAEDRGRVVCVDAERALLVAGKTSSSNFPYEGGYQSSRSGSEDLFVTRVVPLPGPTDLQATVVSSSRIDLAWSDNSDNEDGFEIERRTGAGSFQPLTTRPAGTSAFSFVNAVGNTTYGFRVRATAPGAVSPWSNEAEVTTPPGPPGPPLAPSGLSVTIDADGVAHLLWTDGSDSEDFFEVSRRPQGGAFAVIATRGANATSYADAALLPDRTYGWRVRSGNVGGFSLATPEVEGTTPATLDVALVKGKLVDSAKAGKDSLRFSAVLALEEGGIPDLVAKGLEVRLGDFSGQRLLLIPAADVEWKLRKGKATWKAPKGSFTKAKVVLDPATGTVTVKLGRLTLEAPPASPVRLSLGSGPDAGNHESAWVESKPGKWAYP